MRYRFIVSVVTVSVLGSAVAFSGTMGPVLATKEWGWVTSVSAGPIWAKGGETQTFYLTPTIEKSYVARKSTNTLAFGELFVGLQHSLNPQWLGQLGLAAATTGNTKLQGVIWDDADPQFTNHSYQYKVRTARVALKGKLVLDEAYTLMPWVSTSIGIGFNRAYDFNNTPWIFEALPNNNFENHTNTSFTYTLGVGVQKTISEHWQMGVGYEFADWGKSQLGRAAEQTLNGGLTLHHLYTNGVLFNFTYSA